MKKVIGTGIQDYEKLRIRKGFYIDKSERPKSPINGQRSFRTTLKELDSKL